MKKVFLGLLTFGAMLLPWGQASPSKPIFNFPQGDGVISFYNTHLKEEVTVQYRQGERKYIDNALAQINHVLRCRMDHQATAMDLRLIELVDHLQDHFDVETIHVISAYRTPTFNSYLRRRSRRVASRSRHMLGEAMDLKLPGVSSRKLREYLIALHTGGVGYYGANRFVHVDVGPFRTW